MKMSLKEARERAVELMHRGYHCGPSVLQVMCEAYGIENEDVLWAGTAFTGGIAGHQTAPCGAVSGATVALGLRHICPASDPRRAKQERSLAREEAGQLVGSFIESFGSISCIDLLGIDFSQPGAYQAFRESGVWKDKCNRYVEYVIERLYELDEERSDGRGP